MNRDDVEVLLYHADLGARTADCTVRGCEASAVTASRSPFPRGRVGVAIDRVKKALSEVDGRYPLAFRPGVGLALEWDADQPCLWTSSAGDCRYIVRERQRGYVWLAMQGDEILGAGVCDTLVSAQLCAEMEVPF